MGGHGTGRVRHHFVRDDPRRVTANVPSSTRSGTGRTASSADRYEDRCSWPDRVARTYAASPAPTPPPIAAPGSPKKEPTAAPMAPPSPAHPAQEIGRARRTQRDCSETTTSPLSRGGPSTSWVAQKVCSSSGDRKRG